MRQLWIGPSIIAAAVVAAFSLPGCDEGEEGAGAPGSTSLVCPAGFRDCDGDPVNGCEGALETSILNCGACGVACEAGANEAPLCSAGACIQVCEPGFDDCDGASASGCEIDTLADPKHCGACGTACKEGCLRGACDVTELATAQGGPTFLVVDDTSVYWSNSGWLTPGDGSIMKVPKGGGAVAPVAEGQAAPRAIALDADHVYWANFGSPPMFADGSVMRAPKGGGTPETIASGQLAPWGVAVIGSAVYWTTETDVMRKVVGDPGDPVSVAAAQARPISILAVGKTLYWINLGTTTNGEQNKDGSVVAMPEGGTPAALVSGLLFPFGLTTDAVGNSSPNYLYWHAEGAILRKPLAGGPEEIVLDNLDPPPWRLAADGASVFWTTPAGAGSSLMSASLSSKEAAVVAPNQMFLWDVAVDAERIFWVQNGDGQTPGTGAILSISK